MLSHPPLSLYVHLPWCVRKCPYCDFNSHQRHGELPFEAYVDALIADLDQDLPLVWGRVVHSVFFGGGTPSLFPPAAIDCFLQAAGARLRFAPNLEITLETNPGTAEHGRFELYRAAGVNRLSFGVQSFDDGCLQRLGRIHDSAQAVHAITLAQDAGFDNFNIDLMYALPGQTLAMAAHDIDRALALSPTHLSHYQLTLEPETAFAKRPPAGIPDEDAAWDMQEHCQRLLAAAGFEHYEVSAYAKPGAQCQHNRNYWLFGDYLGIGAGAHGKLTVPGHLPPTDADAACRDDATGEHPGGGILRRWKLKSPTSYMAAAGSEKRIGGDEWLSATRRPFDFMLNALRLPEGFDLSLFEARTGLPRAAIGAQLKTALARGWITHDGEHVQPTELGQRFTNDVIALFLPEDGGRRTEDRTVFSRQ
ncbi:MAG: radical SAM family heme chaperone HemW [Proteobacteria bacterium]|nr:radical SAM family heme chaperone HemW [Pseudomonadota bacterium]